MVEKLEHGLQLPGRRVAVSEREARELDAGRGDGDLGEAHERAGPGGTKGEAGGEVVEPPRAAGLQEDVLTGAPGMDLLAVAFAHAPVVAREAEGDLAPARPLGVGMRGVVNVRMLGAVLGEPHGALRREPQPGHGQKGRGVVDAERPHALLQRGGLDLEMNDGADGGHG